MAEAPKKSRLSPHNCMEEFLGPSAELPLSDLPTLRNILQQGMLLRERYPGPVKLYSFKKMAEELVPLVQAVRRRANSRLLIRPVTLSDQRITAKICEALNVCRGIVGKKKVSFFKYLQIEIFLKQC